MSFRFRVSVMAQMVFAAVTAMLPTVGYGQSTLPPNVQQIRTLISIPPTGRGEKDEAIASEFWRILSNDLSSAGPFQITPDSPVQNGPEGTGFRVNTRVIRGHIKPFLIQVQVREIRTRKLLFKKSYEGSPVLIRKMAHRIADDFTERITGLRGASDSRIVFSQETANHVQEIFQVDRDGENLIQLTHHQSLSLSPTLAPDGRLAYITYKGGPPELWGQRVPGGPHLKLFPTGPDHSGALLSPAWAPVGNKLAFVKSDSHGHCNVMVLDLDRNRVVPITSEAGNNTEPAWEPNGKRIAFTSDRDGHSQIYVMNADGSSPFRITTDGSDNSTPAWKPDGSHIAYVSKVAGEVDVFDYDINERKATKVTSGNGHFGAPVWSPDGRWIAYTNTISGKSRLMVSDLLGRLVHPLGLMAQVQAPDWSRSR